MSIKFKNLNKTIIKCRKCPRLVRFIEKITIEMNKLNAITPSYYGEETMFAYMNINQ